MPGKRIRLLLPMLAVVLVPLAGPVAASAAPVERAGNTSNVAGSVPVTPVVVRDAPNPTPGAIPPPRSSATAAVAPPVALAVAQSTFVVDYDAGFNANPQAKAAFQAAVDVWQSKLSSPVPIRVMARFEALPTNVLGSAGPGSMLIPRGSNLAVPVGILNAQSGADQCPTPLPVYCSSSYDIEAQLSSTFPSFYFGTAGPTPSDKSDFRTVVVHELGHGLGFISSAWSDGIDLSFGFNNGAYFTPMDTMLRTVGDSPLIGMGTTARNTALLSGNLWASGPATLTANGGQMMRIYAPAPFEPGSSISHLDETAYGLVSGESLMTPVIRRGERVDAPGPATLAMLADMGWTLAVVGGRVDGTVTVPAGSSASGMNVELWAATGTPAGPTATATVAGNGVYAFTDVPAGTWNARFVDPADRFTETWFPNATNRASASPITVTVGVTSTANQAVTWPTPSRFVPVAPKRLLDTRGQVAGRTFGEPLGAGQTLDLNVTGGTTTVPTDATAVVLTVTAADVSQSSFVTVWPFGQARPNASSLNPEAGITTPNLVTVKVGANGAVGAVSLYNHGGNVALIADVMGYYVPVTAGQGDGFSAVTPTRLLDTRSAPQPAGRTVRKMAAGEVIDLDVVSPATVADDASAVVLNVTTTGATAGSYITAWPADTGGAATKPNASSANPQPGLTTANLVTVKVGIGTKAGKVSIYNFTGTVDVIIDVVGFFGPTATSVFVPRSPQRILDTRVGPVPAGRAIGPMTTGSTINQPVGNGTNVPADATGTIINLTATNVANESYITSYPTGIAPPLASSLNPQPGKTIANSSSVKLGMVSLSGTSVGSLSLYNASGNVDVLADLTGYYRPLT